MHSGTSLTSCRAAVHRPGVKLLIAFLIGACSQHGQDGRIQSAGEEGAQRDIADELPRRRIFNQFAGVYNGLLRRIRVRSRLQAPVWARIKPIGGQHRVMPGQQGENARKDSALRRAGRSEQEDGTQSVRIDARLDCGMAQDGFEFRAEHESAGQAAVKQGFDAQTVAAQHQPPRPFRPH